MRIEVDGRLPVWDTLHTISDLGMNDDWVIVGGLMVTAYSRAYGRPERMTRDVDLVVDLMSRPDKFGLLADRMIEAGYAPKDPMFRDGPFTRMLTSAGSEIDMLVADHLPRWEERRVRYNGWTLLPTEGGQQALDRRTTLEVVPYGEEPYEVGIPDLLGAIVIKAGAYLTDNGAGPRERHLVDLATLASLVEDPVDMRANFRGSDWRRVSRAASHVDAEALSGLTQSDRDNAINCLAVLSLDKAAFREVYGDGLPTSDDDPER